VEKRVESISISPNDAASGLAVRMLGPFTLARGGRPLSQTPSRKVRALFAYLALAPHPVGRSRLCELLWEIPNDPRGELRWHLSKLRSLLDDPGRQRVMTTDDRVFLDLSDCPVDALGVSTAMQNGTASLDLSRLRALAEQFGGEFMEGLEVDHSPQFESWLAVQRRRFRTWHAAVLEQVAASLPVDSDGALPFLEAWAEVAPFDERAHLALLRALAACGRVDECGKHLAATSHAFAAEGLNFQPVREAWLRIREQPPVVSRIVMAEPQRPSSGIVNRSEGRNLSRRAALAVMPFREPDAAGTNRGVAADGLTHDIITRLAKLRSLFVIARGSTFALAERGVQPDEAGRLLNVDYVASGETRRVSGRFVVMVELIESATARIVWSEEFQHPAEDAFEVSGEICDRIVSSIAYEVETAERNRAILKPPNSLDAWEAYHRGLWHMYRFTRSDNERAQHFLAMALELDPTFARAHAGMSFTHWQNAFQDWGHRDRESELAFEAAGQSLIADEHDPAAHWAMGRALWIRGREPEAVSELERSVDLSPNFALGHYTLAFVQSQSGDPLAAIGSSDHSRLLSPFDPLLFGMLGARAMAHVRLGQFAEAAEWAVQAAGRPNAHVVIVAIAAHCLALAGRGEEGRALAVVIRTTLPNYRVDDFLTTFRFTEDAATLFRRAAKEIGLA
jgi:DNA-binding SARP family transcriptional activator